MTIDERLDRLTERHEALAQSVELLRDTVHDMARTQETEWRRLQESMESLARTQAAESHSLRESMESLSRTQASESRSLQESVQSLTVSTAALLKVAESHERRLGEVERKLAS